MKTVVVEIKGNVAAILSKDGRIRKIKNRTYNIGQEINFNKWLNKVVKESKKNQ